MRYLNKIVFINSATIQYAEVMVNGNVHLIGTQGVGKSTLLRAILFFYNADTLKLGIPREKKGFAEYYFPYQNSYVVYEVMRETGPFCIIAFKSQGKVCYRFFDGGYDKKFFISEHGQAFQRWDETRHLLDAENIYYTRKVDSYGDFRDILYGNHESGKKDFARFALLHSKQYQNIPRTIQNVFLNSKLEAEFIKQTIIMSLNEEEIDIDLEQYAHHLKGFESQLADIGIYKQPGSQKLADNIVKYHTGIRHLQKDKDMHAGHLAWAAMEAQRCLPKRQEKLSKLYGDKDHLKEKKQNAENRHRTKLLKFQGEISILDNDLKKAKEKNEQYSKLGIAGLLEKHSQKRDLQIKLKAVEKELSLLAGHYSELSQKYEALIGAVTSEQQTYVHQQESAKLELKLSLITEERQIRKSLSAVITEIRSNAEEKEVQVSLHLEQQSQLLQTAKLKKESIKHQRFLEEELQSIQQEIYDLKLSSEKALQEASFLKSRQETLEKQWELEEARIANETATNRERNQEKLKGLEHELESIKQKLEGYSDALYGWLNTNRKGWEETIGKVINESVLFSKELSPELGEETESFYGITLRLDELSVPVKTIADYEAEQIALQTKVQDIKDSLQALETKQQEGLEKLKRKYQPQIKQCRDGWAEQNYIAERDSTQLKAKVISQRDIEIRAGDEKRQALADIEEAIGKANEAFLSAQQSLSEIRSEISKLISSREREAEKKIITLEKENSAQLKRIDEAIAVYISECDSRKADLLKKRDHELAGKGIDTRRINELERQQGDLAKELQLIEANAATIAEYNKDKRELFDKVDEFKNRKTLLEQQVEGEEIKFTGQQQAIDIEIAQIDEQARSVQKQIDQLEEDIALFATFQLSGIWAAIDAAFKEEREANKTEKRCKVLIDEINQCDREIIHRWDLLKDATNRFLGNFSATNIFSFKTVLSYNEEYSAFAEELSDFIQNSKIDQFERRINERFATIINSVGKETTLLMSKSGEIQKVIFDINKDFDSKNFVTAIQKIELRLDDSVNPVVKLLMQIREFNDEHAYDLGAINLFSSVDQDAKNKRAIDLLSQLGKVMADYKRDKIALSDTFELKFRIEENHNDSGWVEKLSNVGSEGTDVLVKAMINIMLLNVFKEGASRKFKDFRLHCMMDEIGKLHPVNVKGILQFANDRNINLVNGSPTETNAFDYKHIYRLEKDVKRNTRIKRIITNTALA